MTSVMRSQGLKSLQSDSRPRKVRINTFFSKSWILDATKFKEAFEAAQAFNKAVKDGKPESELVMAPVVEDKEEPVETHDDPDVNKTADVDGTDEWD